MDTKKHTVWLFCRVIDNFGDIGVSWRLAKQLAQEQQCQVVLWVDDVGALQALLPQVDTTALYARYEGIEVLRWQEDGIAPWLERVPSADVVIETFACEVPDVVKQWMVGRPVL